MAVATAVPSYAVSPGDEPPVAPDLPNSFGCKWPGEGNTNTNLNKGFRIYIPFDNNSAYTVRVDISAYTVTAGGTDSRDYQAWTGADTLGQSLLIGPGSQGDFWVTWHDSNSGNNKTMTVTYTYTIIDGPSAETTYGPFTKPVAKVFNRTCTGLPQPTVSSGASTMTTESSPSASDAETTKTQEGSSVTEDTTQEGSSVTEDTTQEGSSVTEEPQVKSLPSQQGGIQAQGGPAVTPTTEVTTPTPTPTPTLSAE